MKTTLKEIYNLKDTQLKSLANPAGQWFAHRYEESVQQLNAEAEALKPASLKALEQKLPTLSTAQLVTLLKKYVTNDNRQYAEAIVSFLETKYTDPSNAPLIYEIFIEIQRNLPIVSNNTLEVVLRSLHKLHIHLKQKQSSSTNPEIVVIKQQTHK